MNTDTQTDSTASDGCGAATCSAWLFPEIEEEVREERSAAAREAAQRVRDQKRQAVKFLRGRNITWLIDLLADNGPMTDHQLLFERPDNPDLLDGIASAVLEPWALWRIGKLWRQSRGIHPGSGEECYLYGIRGVHKQNAEEHRQ